MATAQQESEQGNSPWNWEEELKGKPDEQFVTVMFDHEDEYARFVDAVFDKYGSEVLDVPPEPIATSVEIMVGVLRHTYRDYPGVRPILPTDLEAVEGNLARERPWDPETVLRFPIPTKRSDE